MAQFDGRTAWHRAAVVIAFALMLLAGCANSVGPDSPAYSPNRLDSVEFSTLPAASRERLRNAERSAADGDESAALQTYLEVARLDPQLPVIERAREIADHLDDFDARAEVAVMLLQSDPDNLQYRREAARAMTEIGEVEAAFEIARHTADGFVLMRDIASRAVRSANPRQQNWLLSEVTQLIPSTGSSSAELYLARGLLLMAQERLEAAEEATARALSIDPDHIESSRLLAEIYARENRTRDALLLLERLVELHPDDLDLGLQYAAQLLQEDPDAGIAELERLLDERGPEPQLLVRLSQVYMTTERYEDAARIYRQLAEIESFRDVASYRLGELAERAGEAGEAIAHYRRVGSGNLFAAAQERIGDLLLAADQVDAFSAHFRQLRRDYPEPDNLWVQVEVALLRSRELYPLAIEVLGDALAEDEGNATLLYDRALLYGSLGEVEAAERDLLEVIAGEPDNDDAMNALGYTLLERPDRIQEGYDWIARALAIDPEDPATLDSMGWALYKLGRYREALPFLERALQLYYDPEVVEHVALTFDALGRRSDAIQLLRRALEDHPDSRRLQRALDRLEPAL